MSALQQEALVGLSQVQIPFGTHACLLYDDEAERQQMIAEFIKEGVEAGERVGYFTDAMTPEQGRTMFTQMGVMGGSVHHDAFHFIDTNQICRGYGSFEPNEFIDRLYAFCSSATKRGYLGARICGEMSWSLKSVDGRNRLINYEAEVSNVIESSPASAICQYDFRLFGTKMIADVIRVHPVIIINGMIIQNPFYVDPDEFVEQA